MALFNLNPNPFSLDTQLSELQHEFTNMFAAMLKEVIERREQNGIIKPQAEMLAANKPEYVVRIRMEGAWENPELPLMEQKALDGFIMFIQRLVSKRLMPMTGMITPEKGPPYYIARIPDGQSPSPRFMVRVHTRVPGVLDNDLTLYIGYFFPTPNT